MTKIKANQLEIREILNDPAAQASETWKGTLRIATQAEVNGGSPYDNTLTITPETLAGSNFNTNWLTANNGDDFVTAPIATGVNSIVIGHGANATWLGAIAIGTDASASANYEGIAIGVRASADYHGVALGWQAKTTGNANVSVGTDTKAYGARSIAIGAITEASATSNSSIAMGYRAKATLNSQIVIGHHLTDVDVATDVAYSVKLGYAVDGNINKNILHLHSKGKLELVGDEAQFIFPNYSPTGSPATALPSTTNQGGTIYDFDTKTLKFYNGTTWTELNSQNWLTANIGDDFTTAPVTTALFAIALGDNTTTAALNALAIGRNADATTNAPSGVAIGFNSKADGSSAIAIGNASVSGTSSYGGTIAIGSTAKALKLAQISIGQDVLAATVTPSDVDYSVKIGYGTAGTNKNMLHLFSKGKLELYGEEAQYIMPNYAVTGSPIDVPAVGVEGGVVYDSVAKGLQLYDGASWSAIGGGSSWTTTGSDIYYSTGKIGMGTSGAPTDGTLHIQNGSAGAIAAATSYDELVVESSGNTGISILAPDTSLAAIMFGNPTGGSTAFQMYYQKSAGFFRMQSATLTDHIVLSPNTIISSSGSTVTDTSVLAAQQHSVTGALPVLGLRQIDQDETFILFTGYAANASLTHSIVAEAEVTTATRIGFVKCEISDIGNQITDGAYYMPMYTLA